jgi:TM2 domain-containing membrane protein YozV
MTNSQSKQKLTAALLCFFLGALGIHRFYTGHTLLGILYLITLGFVGVGPLIDFILILTGAYTDKSGNKLV